jgi:amidohydrolase
MKKQLVIQNYMRNLLMLFFIFMPVYILSGQKDHENERIHNAVDKEVEKCIKLYKDLHKNPELSLMEFETSRKMASELKSIGFEVTSGVGGNGVVGIFKNGEGKTIMLRTDMDALPVKENTGLPYASEVSMNDASGNKMPVMHACGHDLHMSVWLGTLRTLVTLKNEWKGTIVAIAQPAEEISGGSSAMINWGLFKKFPTPDMALCYHVSPELQAGTIGYYPGAIFAGVNSAEITVYGRGGHGAMPHTTIDPIVLSAKIILDIQTIVSREINPVKPAVITVGAINGGAKSNIIPDEVKMLLTLRFFDEDVYDQIKESIMRITRGAAIAAGLPENKLPLVKFGTHFTPPVNNDPALVSQTVKYMEEIIGDKNLIKVDPATVAEDFGKYGITEEKIPIALFWLGGVNKEKYLEHIDNNTYLPPLHNSSFAPDFSPTFKCGVSAMTKAILNLLEN